MSGTPGARRSNTPRKAAGATKKAAGSPRASKSSKSRQPASQAGARRKAPSKPAGARKRSTATPPAPTSSPLGSELVEAPRAALDRLLGTIVLTPSIAVDAANARAIADGIPYAEPADRPKMTRELSRLKADLIAAGVPSGEPPDWTQQTAGTVDE